MLKLLKRVENMTVNKIQKQRCMRLPFVNVISFYINYVHIDKMQNANTKYCREYVYIVHTCISYLSLSLLIMAPVSCTVQRNPRTCCV